MVGDSQRKHWFKVVADTHTRFSFSSEKLQRAAAVLIILLEQKKASRTSSLHGITRGYCVFSRWLKSNSSRLSEAIIWFLDEARLYSELEFPRHVPALVHPPQMCVVYFSSTLCDLVCMCIDSEWKGALYGIHVVKRAILLAVIILFSMVVLTVTAYQAMHWSTHST